MTRWTVGLLAALAIGGFVAASVARALGRTGSRLSGVTTVASQWLAAWVLWGLAGHLAVRADMLTVYEPALFAVLGVPGALWHYRALVGAAPERARVVFVSAQLLWLVIVLTQNGLVF